MASVVNEYDTKIDSKKRFTVRGAKYDYYHVYEYEDGHIELTPRILVHPEELSERTLEMMDRAVENLKKEKTSGAIDLSESGESSR